MELTDRQKQLLITIIKEFINTAEAVGSISLQHKYQFKLSTATIRNEMSELVYGGFLYQKHNSGGRIPTTKGWRYFVEELMTQIPEIDALTKDNINSHLYKLQNDKTLLIKQAIQFLSKISRNATIAIVNDIVYYSGLSDLVKIPEFQTFDSLQNILGILEDYSRLSEILNQGVDESDLNIIIGEESGIEDFREYSIIFSEVRINNESIGYIAVVGPNRMRYDIVISAIQHISQTIKIILSKN